MRRFFNRDERVRRELQKIEGLQLRNEYKFKKFMAKRKITEEIVELSERVPPRASIPFRWTTGGKNGSHTGILRIEYNDTFH